ncbi:hypothetical protein JTE90_003839 [Oedothorax gibbosus]|uniref:Uncharacterized protein n=1 Tax=Oedothorax gibbosus TaxID=931172 RepID=A0AAV6TL23_9ARAC|nr:hypothetical protein JTE90_003839 [Oedothorax gibbosus]
MNNEYPHLKNDIGVDIGGWELKLQNKLKKLRQVDTSLEVIMNRVNSNVPGSKVPRNININPKKGELNWAPDHVPGETSYSVELHKQELRVEASKSEHQQDKRKIAALMSLTYSLGGPISTIPDGDNTPDYGSFVGASPKIFGNGSLRKGSYIIICEDVELNRSEDFLTALCLLVSFFYTMNIQFPEKAINTFKFFQFCILGIQTGRLPPKVKTLMGKKNSS